MYRSYQPITPASNKLLKQRWDDTYFEEHRRKVATSKAVVDDKPPRTYMHLHLKLKKLQLEEERLATIERDNRILLEKMSQIMRTKGRVDNWNDYNAKSLNRTKRQQELLRVTHENQSILKRVLAQKPVYDHARWEDDWIEKEGFMDSISKYPKEWYKKTAAKKKSPIEKTKRSEGSKKEKVSPREERDGRSQSSREGRLSTSASLSGGSKRGSRKSPKDERTPSRQDQDGRRSRNGSQKDKMSPREDKVFRKQGRPPRSKEEAIVVEDNVQAKDEMPELNVDRNEEPDEENGKQEKQADKTDDKPDEKAGKQDEELAKTNQKPNEKPVEEERERPDGKPDRKNEDVAQQDEKPETEVKDELEIAVKE